MRESVCEYACLYERERERGVRVSERERERIKSTHRLVFQRKCLNEEAKNKERRGFGWTEKEKNCGARECLSWKRHRSAFRVRVIATWRNGLRLKREAKRGEERRTLENIDA